MNVRRRQERNLYSHHNNDEPCGCVQSGSKIGSKMLQTNTFKFLKKFVFYYYFLGRFTKFYPKFHLRLEFLTNTNIKMFQFSFFV
jgi:hypothetical protein